RGSDSASNSGAAAAGSDRDGGEPASSAHPRMRSGAHVVHRNYRAFGMFHNTAPGTGTGHAPAIHSRRAADPVATVDHFDARGRGRHRYRFRTPDAPEDRSATPSRRSAP